MNRPSLNAPSTLRHLMVAGVLALAATPALAVDADEMFTDPEMEARAREIGRELRCLVCQNQSIFDSNAGLAKDLRVVVRERMEAGDSDAEVLSYISSRFGDYVLLKPPVSAQTYLLWLAPIGFLALGGALAVSYLRGRRRPEEDPTPMSEDDIAEARRLLSGEEP